MKIFNNIFEQIICPENLFSAWDNFKKNKNKKRDVNVFEWKLEENIFCLHHELKNKSYCHGPYSVFKICDPKPRTIHKATVRDRILHHAVFNVLNPIFEPTFIHTSFSCRENYGTHKGVDFLDKMLKQASRNISRPCFVLKCDVKKFFDTIDHGILLSIIEKRVKDESAVWLLGRIIKSFHSGYSNCENRKGVPIGNLTSQLFANIYLNELDYFIKHEIRAKHYVRYTDDFLLVSENKEYLNEIIPKIIKFLDEKLLLKIHSEKLKIAKINQGVDFLGYVLFPKYRLIRNKTKRRILRKLKARIENYNSGIISENSLLQSLQSYLGFLSHANTYNFQQYLKNQFWFFC